MGGADKDSFSISLCNGVLTVATDHTPNYEKKKSYSITLMVEDDEFALGTLDVTVKVRNAEDPGIVSFNAREPQVGKAVIATLDDEDGTVRGQSWQWYRNVERHGLIRTTMLLRARLLHVCDSSDSRPTLESA